MKSDKNLTLRNIVQKWPRIKKSEKSRENSKPRENVSTVRTAWVAFYQAQNGVEFSVVQSQR